MPQFDFGYSWPWTHGHLIVAAVACLVYVVARARRWPVWSAYVLGAVTVWAIAGFLIVHFAFRFNAPLQIPTKAFLASGTGKVLDMGCGSGRSTLMVLLERPGTTVVALDNFSAEYIDDAPVKLRANLRAGGVEGRARIQPGDMRAMPFESESFDAVVSTYAIDHLGTDGSNKALAEVERVLRPGGEFLIMVMKRDVWMNVAFGPLLLHQHGAQPNWRAKIEKAGLSVVEEGALPGTLFLLCRKAG
jgi:SAM-dependent methyltransferase